MVSDLLPLSKIDVEHRCNPLGLVNTDDLIQGEESKSSSSPKPLEMPSIVPRPALAMNNDVLPI
jgi:hypothetical protein